LIVYKLTNKVNGKIYVGQTRFSLDKRFKDHIYGINAGARKHLPLNRALKKYGGDHFKKEVLCECASLDDLDVAETAFIYYYNSLAPNGYNVKEGGQRRYCVSISARKALSESAKKRGIHPNFAQNRGKKTFLGRKHSKESKEKIRIKAKERYLSAPHPCTGKKLSQETKNKISQAHKGKKLSEEHKRKIARTNRPSGWKHTEESRKKIAEKAKIRKNKARGPYQISPEKRLELSIRAKEQWKNQEFREKALRNLENARKKKAGVKS